MLLVFMLTEEVRKGRDETLEKLIARMSLGEVAAMGDLYDLIVADVYAYALSKTLNKEGAEDATHDTFVQVWKSAKQYKPLGKPLAWIFTIEMNLIRKQFNKLNRCVLLDESIEIELEDGDLAERVVTHEFLQKALTALCEDDREIVTLHIVSGLKHREIAKLLSKPLSTVLSKYNRAIKKLRNIMEKEEGLR